MANASDVARIRDGIEGWNGWRGNNFDAVVDLTAAELTGANLRKAKLDRANLSGAHLIGSYLIQADLRRANLIEADLLGSYLIEANLREANLSRADLRGADLHGADLRDAKLIEANLCLANLRGADLRGADLSEADLSRVDFSDANLSVASLRRADLREANLSRAILVKTNLMQANLTECRVFGMAAWGVLLDGATQKDIVITPADEQVIEIDRLDLAQFVYLLLNNSAVRNVIDTIASKVVLILGRFSAERKNVLNALRNELRRRNYLPVLFDFEKPMSRDITETVSTLAHMARFVIADITDARSIPQELMAIVPSLPSVPVQPLLLASQNEYGMFEHFRRFRSVLPIFLYESEKSLRDSLEQKVIVPAEAMLNEIRASAPRG